MNMKMQSSCAHVRSILLHVDVERVLQGLAQAETAYQNALAYARERRQGKALVAEQRDPNAKADPIIVHPDVRRMLMEIKSFLEGARALVLWGALQVDLSRRASSEEERQEADDLVSLLTPVIKGYLTDKGFDSTVLAQQVFGGHGYIREHGVEQFVRDARIAQIYEGTNGIQALDLVGRKLGKDGGRAIQRLFKLLSSEIADASSDEALKPSGVDPVADGQRSRQSQSGGGSRIPLHEHDGHRCGRPDVAADRAGRPRGARRRR